MLTCRRRARGGLSRGTAASSVRAGLRGAFAVPAAGATAPALVGRRVQAPDRRAAGDRHDGITAGTRVRSRGAGGGVHAIEVRTSRGALRGAAGAGDGGAGRGLRAVDFARYGAARFRQQGSGGGRARRPCSSTPTGGAEAQAVVALEELRARYRPQPGAASREGHTDNGAATPTTTALGTPGAVGGALAHAARRPASRLTAVGFGKTAGLRERHPANRAKNGASRHRREPVGNAFLSRRHGGHGRASCPP